MKNREAELQMQIEQVIGRLQKIQRYIAGSRQPATRVELQRLQELGHSYELLQRTAEPVISLDRRARALYRQLATLGRQTKLPEDEVLELLHLAALSGQR